MRRHELDQLIHKYRPIYRRIYLFTQKAGSYPSLKLNLFTVYADSIYVVPNVIYPVVTRYRSTSGEKQWKAAENMNTEFRIQVLA